MAENFKVPYTQILDIQPHPNAERLELAKIYSFQVVVPKNRYKKGDKVIYVPIDSVLGNEIESIVFPADSKVKLHNSRVKQIKLRGVYSQGLAIDPESLSGSFVLPKHDQEDVDMAAILKITKYEPPAPEYQRLPSGPKLRNKPFENPHFRKFNGITNIKWVPSAFKDEEVVLQIKLHGSHIRFGKAPFVANTFWKKVKKFLGLAPKFEPVYGSNNVELTNRSNHTGFYGSDIYGACLSKLNAFDKVKDGEFVHAELIGPGVQKGYTYGHKEHHIVIFDVRVMQSDGTQRWLNPEESEAYAKERGFDFVPVIYKGMLTPEILEKATTGPCLYHPDEVREGCVVKSRYKYDVDQNKQAYKSINPDYLSLDPSDNH